ncbi:AMP-binding protein [Marinovum sp. 2_MG-2023]|uniref:AMP-binding protein n=1 Tax=unclassified Marinovum TaxID=2647166 RepID=UPI0026E32B9B|nr:MULTISPECIES: AMP-binding protein [unclassified Marinovum]MDO6732498.1 AMP-binding protein [Marinovum sp. 2_MG-2023]MDO6780520.1 AMP-binding protein [Marinovum sp. 1_MG-2023]
MYGGFHWDLPERLNMAEQILARSDETLAIIDLSDGVRRDVTFGALRDMVARVAGHLEGRVAPGDRVGVLLGQDPWCAAAHLAIWAIGAVSVPLFKLFKQDALASRIGNAGLSLVVTDAPGAALLGDLAVPVLVDALPASATAPVAFAATGPETPAVLIYTSGTTGKPKGALHGHRVLRGHLPGVEMSHDFLGQPDDGRGDCLWTPADWAWIGGLFDVLMPGLALGVPVVACRMAKFTPEEALRICLEGGVRNVFFPPTALRMLKAADFAIPGLRSVASGGEPLGAEMLAWGQGAFGLTINEFYGQTECNMVVSSCGRLFHPVPGVIGRAVPGCEVAVVDAAGAPTAGEGDIAVRRGAASMMLRYWNNPQATAEKFRGDWMLTGDRGQIEGDYVRFVGREDDVISSGGYRIGPAEIEDCLMTHPGVATCGVVGKPDAIRHEIVKAYVVLKPGVTTEPGVLQQWVKDRLASYSYPRELSLVAALPMTVTGKVIRKELKAWATAEVADEA